MAGLCLDQLFKMHYNMTMMKTSNPLLPSKTRAHRMLFDRNLPFRGRSETSKIRYQRRPKHQNRNVAHQF